MIGFPYDLAVNIVEKKLLNFQNTMNKRVLALIEVFTNMIRTVL